MQVWQKVKDRHGIGRNIPPTAVIDTDTQRHDRHCARSQEIVQGPFLRFSTKFESTSLPFPPKHSVSVLGMSALLTLREINPVVVWQRRNREGG